MLNTFKIEHRTEHRTEHPFSEHRTLFVANPGKPDSLRWAGTALAYPPFCSHVYQVIGGFLIRHALCRITDPSGSTIKKYSKPSASPFLDWLAWLALPQHASSRRQQPQQQPQLQSKHIQQYARRFAPRLWLWMLALELWLLLTRRATLRQGAKSSQASQLRGTHK